MGVIIKSFGHFIPEKRVTNIELAKRFNITEEWILERTGIEERRYFEGGATSDMIVSAALQCLSQANVSPTEVDCIIVATMTPDHYCPSTAAIVHAKLKTDNAWGFDIMAACSGYIYAVELATVLLNSKKYRNILVAGADMFSTIIDPSDRKTVLIFSDGAGVSLLQYSNSENHIIDTINRLDSSCANDVIMTDGGSKNPMSLFNTTSDPYLRFKTKSVFDNGIKLFHEVIDQILQKNGMTFDDVDFIIPHQANKRMIEVLAERLSLPIHKFIINIEYIGNTSATTIPIAISESIINGKLLGNQNILIASVGAGFTYAASIIHLNLENHAGNRN